MDTAEAAFLKATPFKEETYTKAVNGSIFNLVNHVTNVNRVMQNV